MQDQRMRSRMDPLVLAALVFAFILFNAAWLWHFRHGQPLDIDEAGYLSIALVDYQGFLHHGLLGFLRAVDAPSVQAPLTPALAGLVFLCLGRNPMVAFLVPLLCAAGCIPASYYLARALHIKPGRALLPALRVACCPMINTYSRDFQFAMPTTLVTTLGNL